MRSAVRSASPPSEATLEMDRMVLEYVRGRGSLEAAVAACVAAPKT